MAGDLRFEPLTDAGLDLGHELVVGRFVGLGASAAQCRSARCFQLVMAASRAITRLVLIGAEFRRRQAMGQRAIRAVVPRLLELDELVIAGAADGELRFPGTMSLLGIHVEAVIVDLAFEAFLGQSVVRLELLPAVRARSPPRELGASWHGILSLALAPC